MGSNSGMPLGKNRIIAGMFLQMADALDFLGENRFKVSAYRKAARIHDDYPLDVEEAYREGGISALTAIRGIGAALSQKIAEFLDTGRMHKYDEVLSQVPHDLLQLIGVQGIRPQTLKLAYDRLGVRSVPDLKRVLADGSLATHPGMGAKKVENIQKGLERYKGDK